MSTFWKLLARSVILSGFIVVVTVSTLCYLAIANRPIPDVLVNITLTVVAFFFGSKVGAAESSKLIS